MVRCLSSKNWMCAVAGLALAAGGLSGCTVNVGDGDGGTDAGHHNNNHDAGPDGGDMDAGDMDAGPMINPTNCTEISLGDFGPPQDDGTASLFESTISPDTGESDPDLFHLEFYGSSFDPSLNGEDTGTFDLSSGGDNNYSTCSRCLLVYQDPNTPGKAFFQYSGSMTVDADSDQLNGTLNGSLSDVTLVEVTIDQSSFVSTPVEGGDCLHIASASISVAPASAPDGWTCDPTFYGDGTYCDCGCGVPDSDCADSTVGSCDYCNDDGSCNTDMTNMDTGCPGNIDSSDNSVCSG